jgi:hypothetical protein
VPDSINMVHQSSSNVYDLLLIPKILSDQIWVTGYFGQPLTYPNFIIFSPNFLCNFSKIISYKHSFHSYKLEL